MSASDTSGSPTSGLSSRPAQAGDTLSALTRDAAVQVLLASIETQSARPDYQAQPAAAMIGDVVGDLWTRGVVLCKASGPVDIDQSADDVDSPPAWAEVLLDSVFTGSRLDFDGMPVPEWLQSRLESEFGMPFPQVPAGGVVHPPGPVDLDDEGDD